MTRRPWVLPVLGATLLVPLATASANPEPKTENPQRAVVRVAKAFTKLESYAVTYEVKGGMGDPKTGQITAASVAETFQGRVVGQLARIEGGADAYRPRAGVQPGAIREGSMWKGVMATETGRKLDRLFTRPEQVLIEVAKNKATARWIPPTGEGAGASSPPPAPEFTSEEEDQGDEDPKAKGKTRARGADREEAAAVDWASQAPNGSHHLRVTGSATTALTFFNQASNTCFGGG